MRRVPAMFASLSLGMAAALPASAQSNDSNISIYGFLKVDVENVRAGGDTGNISRVSNNLSVLGFRGKEDLGGGLQAFFQLEANVLVDVGGGGIGDRNNAVGLRGGFGEISAGQWESPYRFVSVYAIDPFTAGIFASNSILGNGFVKGANLTAPASFDRRQSNLLQYATPNFAGVEGRLAYGLPEEKTATTNPSFFSGLLTYNVGPLYLAYGFERHADYFGPWSSDIGHKIGAAYSFGNMRVRFAFERLRYEPTPATSLSRNAWQLALTHTIGSNILRASYVKAQRSTGNATLAIGGIGRPGSESGASQISLGVGHNLSKRTELWGACTRLSNERDAIYNLSANGFPGLTPGQDPAGCSVGITHRF